MLLSRFETYILGSNSQIFHPFLSIEISQTHVKTKGKKGPLIEKTFNRLKNKLLKTKMTEEFKVYLNERSQNNQKTDSFLVQFTQVSL